MDDSLEFSQMGKIEGERGRKRGKVGEDERGPSPGQNLCDHGGNQVPCQTMVNSSRDQ